MDFETRTHALMMLAKFTGTEVTSQFLRKPLEHFPQLGISIIHNLAEGIFKPAHDKYAFCIWSRSASGHDSEIYPDQFQREGDDSWIINYSAKKGSLDSAVNKSLFACMHDKVPVLVIVTSRPHGHSGGARYRIIGPAMVESYNVDRQMFLMRGSSESIFRQIEKYEKPNDALIYSLRNALILPFQIREVRPKYQVEREIREKAFRSIILDEYRCQCAVCQSKFLLRQPENEDIVEAEAAHIIPVKYFGSDDPRNGLSFCRRHHWAFDMGLFTVTDTKIRPPDIRLTVGLRCSR
jgi:hypothetical protein